MPRLNKPRWAAVADDGRIQEGYESIILSEYKEDLDCEYGDHLHANKGFRKVRVMISPCWFIRAVAGW